MAAGERPQQSHGDLAALPGVRRIGQIEIQVKAGIGRLHKTQVVGRLFKPLNVQQQIADLPAVPDERGFQVRQPEGVGPDHDAAVRGQRLLHLGDVFAAGVRAFDRNDRQVLADQGGGNANGQNGHAGQNGSL